MEDIYNWIEINELITTSGQPTENQLSLIAASGIEVVINLGLTGQYYSLPDESRTVQSLNMEYNHLPVDFSNPTQNNFDDFIFMLTIHAEKNVLIHCAKNMRVAVFVALYGQIHWSWDSQHADRHIQRIWQPDEVWQKFIAAIRKSYNLS